MNPGERTHKAASLRISRNRSLPPHLRARTREITHVYTEDDCRKLGHASELLRQVCDEADKCGFALLLQAKPYDDRPLDADALSLWYARFGFVPLPGGNNVMARPPAGQWKAPLPLLKPVVEAIDG